MLHGALGPANDAALEHVPGREAETARRMLAELAAARSAADVLEARVHEGAREKERSERLVASLRDALDVARAALAAAPPPEELQALREAAARADTVAGDARARAE
eukprot:10245-Chlamydomonas_euryale.AAC.1